MRVNWLVSEICKTKDDQDHTMFTVQLTTMESPNSGHHWDPPVCPLKRGCPLSEIILYRVCILLILVCPLLGGLSSFRESFIGGFTVFG